MLDFSIRPVTQQDLPDILEVYRSCEDFLALGPVPVASMDMVLADIAMSASQDGIFCGIFDPAGKILGVLDYLPDGFEGLVGNAFLELLIIRRECRGSGLGCKVVEWLVHKLVNENHTRFLWAGVQVNNPSAVQFWKGQGFAVMSEPELLPDQTIAVRLLKVL